MGKLRSWKTIFEAYGDSISRIANDDGSVHHFEMVIRGYGRNTPHKGTGMTLDEAAQDALASREAQFSLMAKRNKFRRHACSGCRHDYYNWEKPQGANGDVAVAEDYCCWHMRDAVIDPKTGKARCNR